MKLAIAKIVTAGLLIGSIALPLAAQAQGGMSVPARLARQHRRIHQGVASGRLSKAQAWRLHSRDMRIHGRAMIDRSEHGGRLTAGEHRRLEGRLNRTSKTIYRRKHQ
jgi:hypothetical protein